MSDERNATQHEADRDPDVSRVYREIATERAPATLNEMVLARAARGGQRAYPRWAPWFRPLAWAATIALSLAIVLELSEAPQQDTVPAAERKIETDASDLPTTAEEAVSKSEAPLPAAAPAPHAEPARRDADAFSPKAATALEQAADLARLRDSGSRQGEERAAANGAAADVPGCDEADRRTAKSWLECIETLRESGQEAAAERELEALEAAFPPAERR